MEKKRFFFIALSLVTILLYIGCDRDSDGEEVVPQSPIIHERQEEVKPKHCDPVFDTLVCYPVGTTWEKGYSVDDFEHLYVRSRFEVVSDTLIDGKHYKRVKGEIVHFDLEHVPDEYKGKAGIFPGMENTLDPLDFYLYEDKGVVTAYGIDQATQRPKGFLKQYDFNWPPYIHGLLFYSDGNVVDAEIPRSSITLLDGNDYEIEDYRVYTRLMIESMGDREWREAFLVKTIGCIYAMFGIYFDDYILKGRLLSFHRNGELLYEYGKVELPEKKRNDRYPSPLEKFPDLIGTWEMVEYYDRKQFITTKFEEGSVEWTIDIDGHLYVKCDTTKTGSIPFLTKGRHGLDSVTETGFNIDGTPYLYFFYDGTLNVFRDVWYNSTCTFKRKQ